LDDKVKKVSVSTGMRLFWTVSFVIGLVCLGAGVVFLLSGPEMIVLAVVFAVPGAFIVIESFGRMLGWEK
jgi:hypothetical protein